MRRFCSPYILLSTVAAALVVGHTAPVFGAAPSLREAVEAAWVRQPEARALSSRQEELAAKRHAASAMFPEPTSITLAQRTDRFNQNRGERETEAEVSVPLWVAGTRASAQRLAKAESGRLDVSALASQLKVAGEVRDAYWQARLAQNEHDLAARKANDAALLMQDVERRVKAGELARADLNQAQGTERLARATLADANARAFRSAKAFATLTGLTQLPDAAETMPAALPSITAHPRLAASSSVVEVRKAFLRQAGADRRDPPELSLGMRRERSTASDAYDNSVRVAIRIPLATDARNRPRVAAANAELIEAETALALEHDRIQADIDAAQMELDQARRIETLAEERFRLASDTQSLYGKAFRLGELDLPTRLRAENDRFDAELALSRARLEVGRAVSQLNQALGLLP